MLGASWPLPLGVRRHPASGKPACIPTRRDVRRSLMSVGRCCAVGRNTPPILMTSVGRFPSQLRQHIYKPLHRLVHQDLSLASSPYHPRASLVALTPALAAIYPHIPWFNFAIARNISPVVSSPLFNTLPPRPPKSKGGAARGCHTSCTP